MGLIDSMQQGAAQPAQGAAGAGNDSGMHSSLMQMLGAALLGDVGKAVAGRLQAGQDKTQGVADGVAGGIFTILKQAKAAGRSVPAKQIVKAVYAGCREMLSAGGQPDPETKIDALFRAMEQLKRMDADDDVIDDQILAEAGQLLQALVRQFDEAEQAQAPAPATTDGGMA